MPSNTKKILILIKAAIKHHTEGKVDIVEKKMPTGKDIRYRGAKTNLILLLLLSRKGTTAGKK